MSPRTAQPLSLEYALLGVIRRKPIHGYDLLQILAQADGLGAVWRIKQSLLYATLEKLEEQSLLQSRLAPGEAFPMRKEYRITPRGEQAFFDWIRSPVRAERGMRQEFLAKIYFAGDVERGWIEELCTHQAALCSEWLKNFQRKRDACVDPKSFSQRVTAFRIRQVQATLDWLEEIQASL
jgi:PadR family transcriptional regulator, regulatory protein AphA